MVIGNYIHACMCMYVGIQGIEMVSGSTQDIFNSRKRTNVRGWFSRITSGSLFVSSPTYIHTRTCMIDTTARVLLSRPARGPHHRHLRGKPVDGDWLSS